MNDTVVTTQLGSGYRGFRWYSCDGKVLWSHVGNGVWEGCRNGAKVNELTEDELNEYLPSARYGPFTRPLGSSGTTT